MLELRKTVKLKILLEANSYLYLSNSIRDNFLGSVRLNLYVLRARSFSFWVAILASLVSRSSLKDRICLSDLLRSLWLGLLLE